MSPLLEISLAVVFLVLIVCGISVARHLQSREKQEEIHTVEPECAEVDEACLPRVRSKGSSLQPKRHIQDISIEHMEVKARKKEALIHGYTPRPDENVNFTTFVDSLSRISIDKLERYELEQLIEDIDFFRSNLRAAIVQIEVNQEHLSAQLNAAEANAQSSGRQMEEADREDEEKFAKKSDVNLFDSEVCKYQELLDSSRKETCGLKQMETKLGRKKEEILKRIAKH